MAYYHGAACYHGFSAMMDCIPSNHEAKYIRPPLSYLLAGVYLVTAMPKVNNIAGLGHYNLFMLSYTAELNVMITRFMARQETSKGLNCSDTLRKK